MYRLRLIAQVKYGHFKEYFELSKKMNELIRERGWTEFTVWAPVVGVGNEVIAEADYPDLATFEKEGDAFQVDAEAMALNRSFAEHTVQGSARSELLSNIPDDLA
jgi:hypothetical protein